MLTDTHRLNPNHYVIIRIWSSAHHEPMPGEDVGHISLETYIDGRTQYMSLWPERPVSLKGPGIFQPVPALFKPDYPSDFAAESRAPEYIYYLYSLDLMQMENAYTRLHRQITGTADGTPGGWCLVGASLLFNGRSGHSCASLAYEILKAGGIYDLIASKRSSALSFAPSPDMLISAVIEAKEVEQERYPETISPDFYRAGETPVPQDNPKSGLGCNIL